MLAEKWADLGLYFLRCTQLSSNYSKWVSVCAEREPVPVANFKWAYIYRVYCNNSLWINVALKKLCCYLPDSNKSYDVKHVTSFLISDNQLTRSMGYSYRGWPCGFEIQHPQLQWRHHKIFPLDGAHYILSMAFVKACLGHSSWVLKSSSQLLLPYCCFSGFVQEIENLEHTLTSNSLGDSIMEPYGITVTCFNLYLASWR